MGAKIARGGMATVYEATDLRLDRPVAIKVMPHALADNEEFSQRFVREARAAARLTHPNVVAVYDQGDDDGTLFLAMEYVAGRVTLRDVIRADAPLAPGRALALFEEILKAIAAAHESGIIHRDVKPENVLIDPRGRVKVADFGLARAISSATTATATAGVLMGTVSYIAPELVTEGRSDARSDVYALGVLLFELLTGHKPHTGDSPIQVAYKHVHDDVPAPSAMVDGIPPYLDAFVARATARQRDLRPADAHVMLQQLRRVRHALDHGVVNDEELTSDLTPTVAVGTAPGDGWAYDDVFDLLTDDEGVPSQDASQPPPASEDEVFDVA
ncbi:MAG: serine/threonine protein kinase, partial [Nocardioidaceae bacterium]|nr:serine/threonine protein kinase [Nocardioidaceae bacterium]